MSLLHDHVTNLGRENARLKDDSDLLMDGIRDLTTEITRLKGELLENIDAGWHSLRIQRDTLKARVAELELSNDALNKTWEAIHKDRKVMRADRDRYLKERDEARELLRITKLVNEGNYSQLTRWKREALLAREVFKHRNPSATESDAMYHAWDTYKQNGVKGGSDA